MEVIEAICTRRSIRDFKPDPVPRKVLEEILDICRWSPSWANTQCWEFAVVGGEVLEELKNRLEEKVRTKAPATPDVPPPKFIEPYLARSAQIRDVLDRLQYPTGTELTQEMRDNYLARVMRFHEAPNAVIVYTDKALGYYLIHDIGIVVDSICLAAHAYGLGTCITVRVVYYPDVLRDVLNIPESKMLVMGIDIGYPDPDAPFNNYPRSREPLESMVHWYGV